MTLLRTSPRQGGEINERLRQKTSYRVGARLGQLHG